MKRTPKPEAPDPLYLKLFEPKPRKGDLKKMAILTSAIEVLGTEGLDALNFDNIGKAMGIRRSHVAYYFKTRDELMQAILKYTYGVGQECTVQRMQRATSQRARVLAVVEGAFDWLEKYPLHAAAALAFQHLCSVNESYRNLNHEIRMMGRLRLRTILLGDEKPTATRMQAADQTATEIQNYITGALNEYFTTNVTLNLRELARTTGEVALRLAGRHLG